MPDLTPITREEMFLDGNTELTPITREEMILAGADIDVITRREWFLKKYRSGGDITIEPITITENGTTTAPSGKAYSPIYTNVGLPENAYLLKNFENVPSDIATFTDGSNLPMPSLKVGIEPIQEGSGDPSPSNVRPISGWTEAEVTVADDITNKAYFDGLMNGTYGVVDLGSLSWETRGTGVTGKTRFVATLTGAIQSDLTSGAKSICDKYGLLINGGTYNATDNGYTLSTNSIYVYDEQYNTSTAETFKTAMNGVYLIYELATPTTPTVTPSEINELYEEFGINGHTTTIPFLDAQGNPVTVYGGELDCVDGTVKPNIEYDSYNGETLVGRWISDRDVYAEGTSPTIGAQVVDLGAYGSDISVQPTSIKSIEGVNNVWADCGDIIDGQYFSKGGITI